MTSLPAVTSIYCGCNGVIVINYASRFEKVWKVAKRNNLTTEAASQALEIGVEIPLWLTLHALLWCSLQRKTLCVSFCWGKCCCWAGWQATTWPKPSVSRPGGPVSWLSREGWKSKEEPVCPSHFVRVWPKVCHSCPRPLRTDTSMSQRSVLPCKNKATSVFSCAVISCNMASISGRSLPLSSSAHASLLAKFARNRAIPSAYVSWRNMLLPLSPPSDLNPNINLFL